MKFTLEVYKDYEWCEVCPEFAVAEISDGLLERIREMRDAVEQLEAYHLAVFDYSTTFYDWGETPEGDPCPGEESHTDLHILHVSKEEFWWSGAMRGSSMGFRTEEISVDGRNPFRNHNVGKPIREVES